MTDEDENEIQRGDDVRFTPPGLDRDSREGKVMTAYDTGLHGTILHIRDRDGNKYQLSPEAIED